MLLPQNIPSGQIINYRYITSDTISYGIQCIMCIEKIVSPLSASSFFQTNMGELSIQQNLFRPLGVLLP